MVLSKFKQIKEEYYGYSHAERVFICSMMFCLFAITAEAAITRATTNSVFIATYTVKFFPIAWFALVPLNLIVVGFYNRFLPSFGCIRMLFLSLMISTGINGFSAFFLGKIHLLPFFLYLWKDVFIILMFQQIWSVIHATINISKAKYLYGIFFGMGGAGSILGSIIPGFLAMKWGSERLLLATIPFYIIVACFYYYGVIIRKKIPLIQDISLSNQNKTDVKGGIQLIASSKFLQFILLLVAFMQVSATILDYQFSYMLESFIPHTDRRTEFIGRFFGVMNTINVLLQFMGAFLLLKIIGLKGCHLFVPFILLCNVLGFLFRFSFSMMGITFASIKCFDYSVFGIIKEMLYIPLQVDEKFKAKAIIDVFVYRTSKAFSSFFILMIQIMAPFALYHFLSWSLAIIFSLWIFIVLRMFKYYYAEVEKHSINWPGYHYSETT